MEGSLASGNPQGTKMSTTFDLLPDSRPGNLTPDLTMPLERLRGRILRFLIVRGVLFSLICLGVAFWGLMLLDFGVFSAFGLDWAQVLPAPLRGLPVLFLLAILGAIIVFRVVQPALLPLSRSSLAILLERRFPAELREQLITAVDLGDPDEAERRGYSRDMAERVFAGARSAISKANADLVLDWPGLSLVASLALLVCIVPWPIALGMGWIHSKISVATDPKEVTPSSWKEIASILLDRNVLLKDLAWPRRSFLVLEGFPASGETVIGQDLGQVSLRVRAVRHLTVGAPSAAAVTASGNTLAKGWPAEGWRPLTWFDLQARGWMGPVSDAGLSQTWQDTLSESRFTIDALESLLLEYPTIESGPIKALREAMERLHHAEESMADSSLKRRQIPTKVIVFLQMPGSNSTTPMQPVGRQEFTTIIKDLRESALFTVKGDDYSTAGKRIRVVAPPRLESLDIEEQHPAYLFYRPGNGGATGPAPASLIGQRQSFLPREMLQPGSDQTRFAVPRGARIVLTATGDRPLQTILVERSKGETVTTGLSEGTTPKASKEPTVIPAQIQNEKQIRLEEMTLDEDTNLQVKMTDEDGVVGVRRIAIKVLVDTPPQVKAEPSPFLRRNDQGVFLVTPEARIPFNGTAEDRQGLGTLEHSWTVEAVEGNEVAILFAAAGVGRWASVGLGDGLGATTGWLLLNRNQKSETPGRTIQRRIIPALDLLINQTPGERLDAPTVSAYMTKKMSLPFRDKSGGNGEALPEDRQSLIRRLQITPDLWEQFGDKPRFDFSMDKAGIPQPKMGDSYLRHRVSLWLEATDLDLELDPSGVAQGPHRSPSQEAFSFLVIPEEDLLQEVRKDEIKAQDQLELVRQRILADAATAYLLETSKFRKDPLWTKLSTEDWRTASGRFNKRTDDPLDKLLEESQKAFEDLATQYQTIVRELELNHVTEKIQVQKRQVRDPLGNLRDNLWPDTKRAFEGLRQTVAAGELDPIKQKAALADTNEKLTAVLLVIDDLLSKMGGTLDFDKELARAREIERAEKAQFDLIQKLHEELVKRALEDALNPK